MRLLVLSGTYPPEQLQHGLFISGWDAPVAFEADRSFVSPVSWHADIVQRFGPQRFDDVDEFDAESAGWHSRLPAALCARIERRCELASWLLAQRSWDLFAVYFGESDTAAHHLWALHDPHSPRRPAHVDPEDQTGLARVYQALDRAVGELLFAAGGSEVEISVVSDHGSGGASNKVMYLNRVLFEAGFLRFRPHTLGSTLVRRVKDIALTRLPARLRERAFRSFGTRLPSWLESKARFGAIDMANTRAFSDELNYFPAIHWNLRGREPQGTLDAADIPAARHELEARLLALRDPVSGAVVVKALHARETLYTGPHLDRAPDLVLELNLDRGYSYNLMPSASAPIGTATFRQLSTQEYLGRKGRSLPGSHRARGLFIAAGPSIAPNLEIGASMLDVTATLLARMNIAVPTHWSGRNWIDLRSDSAVRQTLPAVTWPNPVTHDDTRHDEARVANRLRRLGYIE